MYLWFACFIEIISIHLIVSPDWQCHPPNPFAKAQIHLVLIWYDQVNLQEEIAVRKDYKLVFKLENAGDSKPEQRKIKEDFPLWMKVEFEHNHIGSNF